MYYVEARFHHESLYKCDLLQTSADVVAWAKRNVRANLIFQVLPPSYASKEDLETISGLGAVMLTTQPFDPVDPNAQKRVQYQDKAEEIRRQAGVVVPKFA